MSFGTLPVFPLYTYYPNLTYYYHLLFKALAVITVILISY